MANTSVSLNMDIEHIDELTEKMSQLNKLLKETIVLIDSLKIKISAS